MNIFDTFLQIFGTVKTFGTFITFKALHLSGNCSYGALDPGVNIFPNVRPFWAGIVFKKLVSEF